MKARSRTRFTLLPGIATRWRRFAVEIGSAQQQPRREQHQPVGEAEREIVDHRREIPRAAWRRLYRHAVDAALNDRVASIFLLCVSSISSITACRCTAATPAAPVRY